MTGRAHARGPPLYERGFELEADLLRVMANSKRLMIMAALAEGPLTVTELAEHLRLSLQNTSQHLRLMRDRAIVRSERSGRQIRYALTSAVFSRACGLVRHALLTEVRAMPARLEGVDALARGLPVPTGAGRAPARLMVANRG